jgi:GH24 family phage-related lysozyme (muramidase)
MTYTPNNAWDRSPQTGLASNPGPFLAEVMKNDDPLYSGRLLVYIPDFGGDPAQQSSWHLVRYMTPYYGIQPLSNRIAADPAAPETLESYGMWMTPPNLGVKVLVMFINGDRSKGVWIGCLPEIGSHGAIPGNDAGDFDVFANQSAANRDIKSIPRPPHSTAPTFVSQGLANDSLRGGTITTSSLRESPTNVFGFNTPGGHSLFMDDGNNTGENKMLRIRTATGNMIMMNDDNGFVYVINSAGTGWIELSPNGNVDIYGEAGISIATKGNINMHADGNINMHAGQNILAVAEGELKIQGTRSGKIYGGRLEISGANNLDIHTCGELKQTANQGFQFKSGAEVIMEGRCFKWNSGGAAEANQVSPELSANVTGYNTTVDRAPNREPWPGHDNPSGPVNDQLDSSTSRLQGSNGTFENASETDDVPNNSTATISNLVSSTPEISLTAIDETLEIQLSPEQIALRQRANIINRAVSNLDRNGIGILNDTQEIISRQFAGVSEQLVNNALQINVSNIQDAIALVSQISEPLTSLNGLLENTITLSGSTELLEITDLSNFVNAFSNIQQQTLGSSNRDFGGLINRATSGSLSNVVDILDNNRNINNIINDPISNIINNFPISLPAGNTTLPLPDIGNAVQDASLAVSEMFGQDVTTSLPFVGQGIAPPSNTESNCGIPTTRNPRPVSPSTPGIDDLVNPDSNNNSSVSASDNLLDMLEGFEGYGEKITPSLGNRSNVRPYWDYQQWSIGYGSYAGSRNRSVRPDIIWTPEQAKAEKLRQLVTFQQNVQRVNQRGNYQWTQEQIDALTSFAYNIGSIDQLTANGTRSNRQIADAMVLYNRAGGVPMNNLINRRRIEREKFLRGTPVNRLDYSPGRSA